MLNSYCNRQPVAIRWSYFRAPVTSRTCGRVQNWLQSSDFTSWHADSRILRYNSLTKSEQDCMVTSSGWYSDLRIERIWCMCTKTRCSKLNLIDISSFTKAARLRAAETGLTFSTMTWKSPSGMCRRRLEGQHQMNSVLLVFSWNRWLCIPRQSSWTHLDSWSRRVFDSVGDRCSNLFVYRHIYIYIYIYITVFVWMQMMSSGQRAD